MKNRFNLISEQEKNRIMNLHKKHSILNEQGGVRAPLPVDKYKPGKYTRQEWLDAYQASNAYLDKALKGKTVNLYDAGDVNLTPGSEGELLTWEKGPVTITGVEHAYEWDSNNELKKGIILKVEGLVSEPMGAFRLNSSTFDLVFFCDEYGLEAYLEYKGVDPTPVEFIRPQPMVGLGGEESDTYPTYEGGTRFTNNKLMAMLDGMCAGTNPFVDFFNLISTGREVPEADFAMGDEEMDMDVALTEAINRNKELMGVKVLKETIGMEMLTSIDETTPEATEDDYNEFLECLNEYNIDEDVMDNAENFVRMQMHTMGRDKDGRKVHDSNHPGFYTLKIGLIMWNLVKNGYDMYNESGPEPTCAMMIHNKFMPVPKDNTAVVPTAPPAVADNTYVEIPTEPGNE